MPEITKDDKINIEKKLEYIGLDMNKIPTFLAKTPSMDYRPLKSYDDKGYRVYRYLPIDRIQILLTPKNRLDSIQEKYTQAIPIYPYLQPEKEEDILRHTTFLKMLQQVKIQEIQRMEEEQKQLNQVIPFKVKYKENYLWQIYYADTTDTYFMLVPTEDLEYATLFYLLKKQIEGQKKKKKEMIFVPISHEPYSEQYLKRTQIADIEKYIWLFTKQWPLVYEVYDKENVMSIQIVGQTDCYEGIKSEYKTVLNSKEEAIKFYQLMKALFILQTELPHHYQFKVAITTEGGLEFRKEKEIVSYENLAEILNKEYRRAEKEIVIIQKENTQRLQTLEELKRITKKQEREYLQKEKQIATYLSCKKTFFGKVSYFFKSRKLKKEQTKDENIKSIKEETQYETPEEKKYSFTPKEYYTIEDIITIYHEFDQQLTVIKNQKMDVVALENKRKSMELKLKNAARYIEEIDSHEKSIFEFWKFANKDENLLLEEGSVQEEETTHCLEKVFDYQEDQKEIGILIDRKQRKQFSKEEMEAMYLATQGLHEVMNSLEKKTVVERTLKQLKEEAEQERVLFSKENFDIFGGIAEDGTKLQTLGNQRHRENAKDKFKMLEITKNTQKEEFLQKIIQSKEQIQQALQKAESPISIPLYYVATKKETLQGLMVWNMNPEKAIQKEQETIYLYRINIKQNMPVVYFSNSIYFDNYNKTLPYGMDISEQCLIAMEQYRLIPADEIEFRIVEEQENKVKIKTIHLQEYEVIEVKKDD